MNDKEQLKDRIRKAFAGIKYPGDWCLIGSREGSEPQYVFEEFKGKTDWTVLTPEFLDQAPRKLASALSFLSDEAFRFYLPAYLLADIDDKFEQVDMIFRLCHGLDDASKKEKINPQRYGDRTWHDAALYKFAIFSRDQAAAIADYLRYKLKSLPEEDSQRERITQALNDYWNARAI